MVKRGASTASGKAASSRNAVEHGLPSDAPVIPELESFEEWDRHRAGTVASFAPEAYSETDFAGRIALLSWRLKRVARYETEMTAHYLDDIPEDLAEAALYGARALGISRDMTITPDKIDKQKRPGSELRGGAKGRRRSGFAAGVRRGVTGQG